MLTPWSTRHDFMSSHISMPKLYTSVAVVSLPLLRSSAGMYESVPQVFVLMWVA